MKEPQQTQSSLAPTLNPYLAARREWNERYGSYIARENNWRLAFFGCLAITALSLGCTYFIAAQNHVVPYVVMVDKLGQAVPVSEAERASTPDARIIRAQLARFVSAVRSVYADAGAERTEINAAYAMLDQSSQAGAVINDFFRTGSPFERAQTSTVTVTVQSVLPLGGNTWRVEWQEDTRERDGRLDSSKSWQANITTTLHTPTTEAVILVNPMGVYVTGINWSERL